MSLSSRSNLHFSQFSQSKPSLSTMVFVAAMLLESLWGFLPSASYVGGLSMVMKKIFALNKEGNDVMSRRISREVNSDKILQSELSCDLKLRSCKFELLRKVQYSQAFALSECAIYSLNTQSVL